jgi:hypothetical protein
MRSITFFGFTVGTALLAACSGSVFHSGEASGGGGDAGTCVTDLDCGAGKACGYKIADACQATGTCFDAPATPVCDLYMPGCACDHVTTINLGCTVYPTGYASRPVAHTGACDDVGAPPPGSCHVDTDCASNQRCTYKVAEGCNAQIGSCFTLPEEQCQTLIYTCGCDGKTVMVPCYEEDTGVAPAPIAYYNECGLDGGSDGGTFACGSLSCTIGTQVCKISIGGPPPPGATPAYACVAYPTSCASDRSCTCVEGALGAQQCRDLGGDLTVTLEYP